MYNVTLRRVRATTVAVEKTINITCSECLSVALDTRQQIAHALNCIVACGHHGFTYFSTLPHKSHDFRGGKKTYLN